MRVLLMKFGMRPVTAAMALFGVLTVVGCGGNGSSSSGSNATATPSFSPGAGTYNTSQTVTIADTTKGAVLYCTTDGTTPTTSSSPCSQPTTVSKSEFLQAIAVAPGQAPSAVASAGYTIDLNAAPTPTFSPAGSTVTSGQQITISDTLSGANIYYTIDGTAPTVNSTLYTGPVAITKSLTLSAIAVATGFSNSGVASAAYVVSSTPSTPVISPAGGMFAAAQTVTITDATQGATIYYTLDGSTPTASSTAYSGALTVSMNQTVSAIAISPGGNSAVATAAFTISIPAAAAPTFNPGAGTFTSTQQVILNDATAGATIYYTVDGSMPTTSSSAYSSPITVSASETIKAIATAPGFSASAVSSAAYTINVTVAPPTFSPAAGSYTSAQNVTIGDVTPGATIHYTTDGSAPTASSTAYSAPIAVSTNETLSAIAVLGSDTSSVATAAYTINVGPTYTGTVMSGTLPVVGATVQMYAAGNTGYASSATLATSAAATTGSDGSFTLSYNCPAAGGDLVYLVATGGHTGSNTASNAGLAFMVALGPCNGTLPSPVVVNEVTTVASAYALSPFMTGATNVGASASNYETSATSAPGLANAFATVANLVALTTGTTLTNTPAYPTNLAGDTKILNNSNVPTARINTLADALNACAAGGSGCSDLFSAATPTSGTAPSNTLQAILNIAQNPGTNAGMVFSVASESPSIPFMPTLPGAPNDWTLALTFTGGGLGFAPGIPVPFANGGSGFGQFLNTAMAIDAAGNIWITGFNNGVGSGDIAPDFSSGMIAEFSNLGAALTPPSTLGSGGTTAKYGGYIPVLGGSGGSNAGTIASHGIAIDPSGNAWIVGGDGNADTSQTPGALTEIGPGLSVVLPNIQIGAVQAAPPAIDGLGNVWTMGTAASTGANGILEYSKTGNLVLSNNGSSNPNDPLGGYFAMQSLIFDSNASSLWASDPSFAATLYQISPVDGSNTVDYYPGLNGGPYTPLVAGSAGAGGSPGNVYGCGDAGGQTLDVFNVSSTSILTSYTVPTGRGCGNQMVMDGAGHIFTVSGSSTPGILDEFAVSSSGLTLISPATGYTGTTSGVESPTINPDPTVPVNSSNFAVSTNGVAGAAIDGSGNLWVLNADTGTAASPGNVLVEYIGIAAPVVTPTSLALQFGEVGVKP